MANPEPGAGGSGALLRGPPTPCPRCLLAFPAHVVVRARCTREWRGANFDLATAEGNVGSAVAGVLDLRVRTTPDLEAFLRRALVKTYLVEKDLYEFHVGLRDPSDADRAKDVEAAAREAVAKSRHFELH